MKDPADPGPPTMEPVRDPGNPIVWLVGIGTIALAILTIIMLLQA